MALRNLHIRMNQEEYDFLRTLAEELHCSQAEVIRKALIYTDIKEIVNAYRQRQKDAFMQRYVTCGLDRHTAELLEQFRKDLNENTQQIRRIGTNLSSLIRDIRTGALSFQNGREKEAVMAYLQALQETYQQTMNQQGIMAEKAANLLNQTEFKVKINGDREYWSSSI